MLKKTVIILIILLFYSINVHGENNANIEIFDITQGKVVKEVQSDSKIQEMAIKYINGVTGVYGKLEPIPDNGYAIGIHLEPSIKIQGKWLNTLVNEVIIMFPEEEPPFLVMMNEKNKLVCFSFQGDTDKLLKHLKFKLN